MNDKLLNAFKRSKMTKYKLSQETGISNSTLGRWERGETEIGIEKAVSIAKALHYKIKLEKYNTA